MVGLYFSYTVLRVYFTHITVIVCNSRPQVDHHCSNSVKRPFVCLKYAKSRTFGRHLACIRHQQPPKRYFRAPASWLQPKVAVLLCYGCVMFLLHLYYIILQLYYIIVLVYLYLCYIIQKGNQGALGGGQVMTQQRYHCYSNTHQLYPNHTHKHITTITQLYYTVFVR